VKFLGDNQLPAALARFIESRGCHAKHVLDIGLAEASDTQIFRHAESEGYILVSKDEDFLAARSQTRRYDGPRLGPNRELPQATSIGSLRPRLASAGGVHRVGRADRGGLVANVTNDFKGLDFTLPDQPNAEVLRATRSEGSNSE